jgi:tRNA U34 5-methylaminomethyl-2-thiouridine-forming methyltransferase MnmC
MTMLDRLTVCATGDGSFSFHSALFGESFHSTCGAKAEAILKFIVPSGIVRKAMTQPAIHLLDVCFGLSYNTAAALDSLAHLPDLSIEVIGLENNLQSLETAIQANFLNIWSERTQTLIKELCRHQRVTADQITLQLLVADARQTIAQVPDQWADAIFFDPFSPRVCPQLWTIDFCRLVAHKLKPDGYLITYSCASAVRSAWHSLGLHLWAVQPLGRKSPGTIASWLNHPVPDRCRPLTPHELAILQTKAGIPYRDPSLAGSSREIRQRREQEQAQSQRQSSSQWLKQNLHRAKASPPDGKFS